jgi:hypothetical protein
VGIRKPVKLYHGTLRSSLPGILKKGIEVGEGWGGAGTNGVYLSASPEGALYWAKLQHQKINDEKLEIDRFDRSHTSRDTDRLLAIVEVTIPAEKLDDLKADMEQAEDVGFDGSEDDWQASLDEIGDTRFDGHVPPEWVNALPSTIPFDKRKS